MSEEKLKEVQNYIQYLTFRDKGNVLTEMLSEDAIVKLIFLILIGMRKEVQNGTY